MANYRAKGRKALGELKNITFSITTDKTTNDKLEELRKQYGMTRAALIRKLIDEKHQANG